MGRPKLPFHDELVHLYTTGYSASEIAELKGCSRASVYNHLENAKVRLRYRRAGHALNDDFFEAIDSEQKAYWLGFILADGCVMSDNRLSILLQGSDGAHLHTFLEHIGSTSSVAYRLSTGGYGKGNPTACVRLAGKKLVADLVNLGVEPRKSLREKAPIDQIPEELRRHFWRGVIDGDGHVSRTGPRARIEVKLYGSRSLCEQFQEWVSSLGTVKATVRPTSGCEGLFSFSVRRRTLAHRVIQELYWDCHVSLERKHRLAEAWGVDPEQYRVINRWPL